MPLNVPQQLFLDQARSDHEIYNANPEYPWPRNNPSNSPLAYSFPEWRDWSVSTAGRRLNLFVENLVHDYLAYFP